MRTVDSIVDGRPFCVRRHKPSDSFMVQSTRPRGARHRHLGTRGTEVLGFNPRARAGHDAEATANHTEVHNFNPRARVGHDEPVTRIARVRAEFQSTRPRGARLLRP